MDNCNAVIFKLDLSRFNEECIMHAGFNLSIANLSETQITHFKLAAIVRSTCGNFIEEILGEIP